MNIQAVVAVKSRVDPFNREKSSLQNFDGPSPPNTPWLGLSGRTQSAGRHVTLRSFLAAATAPSSRTVFVSISRAASSARLPIPVMSSPTCEMAANGITKSRSSPSPPPFPFLPGFGAA